MALLAPEATEPVTWKVRNDIAAVARLRRKLERSRRVRSPAATSRPVRLRVAAAVDARPGWLRGDRAGAGATQAGRAACRRAWLATGPDLSQRRRDGATRPSRPAACDCEVHQLMQLTQAACRRACARHLARSESAADCPPGRLFSAVRRQGPGAGCNSCTLPIRVVGEDGKSYPERRRISARSAFRSPIRMGLGPRRLRSLTWIRCRTPPFLLLPIPRFGGSVASRCRAQRSTARPSPTRSSRPCGSQPSQRAQDHSNRIVSVFAFDARNLLCPRRIGLTSPPSTDRSMLSGWIADLERARRALGRLIRRLREAAGKGDLEAARQGHDPSGPD